MVKKTWKQAKAEELYHEMNEALLEAAKKAEALVGKIDSGAVAPDKYIYEKAHAAMVSLRGVMFS